MEAAVYVWVNPWWKVKFTCLYLSLLQLNLFKYFLYVHMCDIQRTVTFLCLLLGHDQTLTTYHYINGKFTVVVVKVNI